MATTVDRDQIVPLQGRQFAALDQLCAGLDEEAWSAPTCLPGWSVQDVLAHIVGTESILLGEPGPQVDTSHLTHMKNPTAVGNEAWVESMRTNTGSEVLERFRTVTARRMQSLESMTQADLDEPSWTPAGPDETYGRFMRIRHYDCYLHELDIRAALQTDDRTDHDHVAMALTEPVTALGYIVGKKAGVPAGSSVRIRLTGPVEAVHLVEVDDRARLVDTLDGEPTAGITLDAVLFLRLTGGRIDPSGPLGTDVILEGDENLARRIATNLAYTI